MHAYTLKIYSFIMAALLEHVQVLDAILRDEISAKTPVEFDPITHEPYLPLPAPLSSYRLTPARADDTQSETEMMNDPAVYPNLIGPPYPYLLKHGQNFVRYHQGECNKVISAWKEGTFGTHDAIPFSIIREAGGTKPHAFVGEIALGRSHFDELVDKEEKERMSNLNSKRHPGDPEIVWDMGVCIMPAFHGKGIATAAIGTLLRKWAFPHMAAHQIVACSFASNIASSKAFLKNGFVIDSEFSGTTVKQEEEKGGEEEKQIVVRWTG